MTVKYDAEMRPILRSHPNESVGLKCPVCLESSLAMPLNDFQEHADGSATARCSFCRAKLRQNQEGFIFLDA